MRPVGVLGVPSSAGARRAGQGQAPYAFRRAGLLHRLEAAGLTVFDYGDLPEVRFSPDPEHPRAQNAGLVREVSDRVADHVARLVHDQATPLILGGDCTLTLGVVAGMLRHDPLRLVYFDGDADLKTPEESTSGILDGMGLAHLVGHGLDALSRCGPRYPLVPEAHVLLFGYHREPRWVGGVELARLDRSAITAYPADELRGHARELAAAALQTFDPGDLPLLVHFDVDVIDFDEFPVADVPHHGGLSFDEAFEALGVFVANPSFSGLVVTEFNVDRDADGTLAERFVDALVRVFGAATRPAVRAS